MVMIDETIEAAEGKDVIKSFSDDGFKEDDETKEINYDEHEGLDSCEKKTSRPNLIGRKLKNFNELKNCNNDCSEWKSKKKKKPGLKNLLNLEKVKIENRKLKAMQRDNDENYNENSENNKLLKKNTKNYICKICWKTFDEASFLKDHLLGHCHRFTCEKCGKQLKSLKNLQKHVTSEHSTSWNNEEINGEEEEEDERVSTKCLQVASHDENYTENIRRSKSVRVRHQCEICKKNFSTIGHLNAHLYSHLEKKWKCDGCGKSFSWEKSFLRHKNTFPEEHWFPCEFCDINFFRIENFMEHLKLKHSEVTMGAMKAGEIILRIFLGDQDENDKRCKTIFICTKCYKIFYSSENLQKHHDADKTCSERNSKDANGKEGKKTENIPNYKCCWCDKEFISLEGYEYHKNYVHLNLQPKKKRKKKCDEDKEDNDDDVVLENNEFVCSICQKSFTVKTSLEIHLKTHNVTKNVEAKPGKTLHQCCICPRSFASSDGLKYHLATHTGERRYSCSQCNKKFIKKTHLLEHKATHSKVKYFKCLRCPRTFNTHSAFRKHNKHFPGPHSFPCTKCGKLFTKESMIEKHICVDLVKVTMAPEVTALLSTDDNQKDDNDVVLLKEEPEFQNIATVGMDEASGQTDSIGKTLESSEKNNLEKDENNKNSHSCYKCFKIFPSLDLLQSHQNEHIGKQNYQCRFCPDNFKRADDFSAHIRNHLGSSPYMCLKCNRKFISPLTLSLHMKKYPGDHSFACQKCEQRFTTEKRLENHECILQNSDKFMCACKSLFKSWNEFVEHAGSTKPYRCCTCDLAHTTLNALARHIKKHTGIKQYSCGKCQKSFRVKNNYLLHLKIHNEEKEIDCQHCEFKSKSQKRMNFHLFRKHGVGSNASSTLCPICGIIFPFKNRMKKHLEMEHAEEHVIVDNSKDVKKALPTVLCTLCGKLLSNKYLLANHMKKVHNPDVQKVEEFKCDECGEKFKTQNSLLRHAEIHEPPFLKNCNVCGQEFYFTKDLRKHMRKHDTNKPFSCEKCGKNFKVSVSLKYHSSICGSNHEKNFKKKRQNEEFTDGGLYYGHNQSLPLTNQPCAMIYWMWNQ